MNNFELINIEDQYNINGGFDWNDFKDGVEVGIAITVFTISLAFDRHDRYR